VRPGSALCEIDCLLSAPAYVIKGSSAPILSAAALQKNGWGVVLPPSESLPASIRIQGVACITLRPGKRFGEHFLQLIPYEDPDAPGVPTWTPFDPTDASHAGIETWELLLDTGATISLVGEVDALKLAHYDDAVTASVSTFEGKPVPVHAAGRIRIVARPSPDAPALDYSALFGTPPAPAGGRGSGMRASHFHPGHRVRACGRASASSARVLPPRRNRRRGRFRVHT